MTNKTSKKFKMHLAFALTLILPSTPTKAEGIIFKPEILGEKVYKTKTESISDSKMEYESDSLTLEKLRAQGIQIPTKVRQSQIIMMKMVTGKSLPDGGVPFSTTVDSLYLAQFINGVYQPSSAPAGIDKNTYFSGIYSKDSMIISEFRADKIPSELIPAIKSSIANMMKSVSFPIKPISVGDEFSQTAPLSIPLPGSDGIKFKVVTTYKLKEIRDGIAHFDIVQAYSMNSNSQTQKITMSGSGSGVLIYDRPLKYITSINTTSRMSLSINLGDLTITSQDDARTNVAIDITSANAEISASGKDLKEGK